MLCAIIIYVLASTRKCGDGLAASVYERCEAVTLTVICTAVALLLGVGAGALNSKLTDVIMKKEITTQKAMAVYGAHMAVCFVFLVVIALAVRLLHVSAAPVLLAGATGLVATNVILSVRKKSK